MVFQCGIDVQVDVVLLSHLGDVFFEEDIVGERRISTGIDGHRAPFERGQQTGLQVGIGGVGQPNALGEELGEDNGGNLALHN